MVEENPQARSCMFMPPSRLGIKMFCFLIIFASGIVIGAGVTVMLVKQKVIWIAVSHKDVNDITDKITEKYGLTPQQTQQVHEIITKAFDQRKLRDAEQDRQRDEYSKVIVSEMNSVLTPEQFTKWSKDFQEMREKFKKHPK